MTNIQYINSTSNLQIKEWVKIQNKKSHRDKSGLFFIEGFNIVLLAIQKNNLESLITTQEIFDGLNSKYDLTNIKKIFIINRIVAEKISLTKTSQMIYGFSHIQESNYNKDYSSIILDGVQEPGNMGTIIRTAIAFGFKNIFLANNCVDPYNDKVIRSTQGAIFDVNIIFDNDLEHCRKIKEENPSKLFISTYLNTEFESLEDLNLNNIKKENVFLGFGNEGNGMDLKFKDLFHKNINIVIENIESLNVSQAATIVMYKVKEKYV
ncbi:RNA methyltransferase [Spiroplasma endosymbiont of Anurida maritima]|uniref:TrmH family RNA methyltransferase n=1 Tax=Spiroplasma endosymbiont of Anurida maritima TaxID=2967972 RepID=UPI0036D3BED1